MEIIKQHILIVDDELINLNLISIIFSSEKTLVTTVQNPNLVMKKVKALLPDIILLDINMPEISGFEICEELKNDNKTKNIPVIFISAKINKKDIIKGFSLGAVDYVIKPFNKEELQARIGIYLKYSQTQRALEKQLKTSKKTETKLKKSKKKYKHLIENQGEGIGIVNLEEEFIFANLAAEKLFEVERGKLVGRNLNEFLDKDQLESIKTQTEKRRKNQQSSYEFILTLKNNKKKDVFISATPKLDKNNNIIGTFGIFWNITNRKIAERARKESEEKYRIIFEKSQDAILLIDNNKFIDCNLSAVKMIGYNSKSELLNIHPSKISPKKQPDGSLSFEKVEKMIAIAIEKGIHTFEWTHSRANGEDFLVEVWLTAIPYKNKPIIHAVMRDLTAQKKSEQDLKENEKRLRLSQKAGQIGSWEWDIKDNKIYWSEITYHIFGVQKTHSFITEKEYVERVFFKDRKKLRNEFKLIFENSKIRHKTAYRIIRNNEIRRIKTTSEITRDKEGNPVKMIGITQDITEQYEIEKKIKDSEEKYRLLTETMKDVVISISPKGKILYVSPSILKFAGYIAEEEIGRHISNYFVKKADLLYATNLLASVIINHESGLFEFLYKSKNKAAFYVEIAYTPLILNAKINAVQIVMRDISKRKANELELEKHKYKLEELVTERTAQLEASRNKFKNIFESSNDAIFITDIPGNFLEYNQVTIDRIDDENKDIHKLNLQAFHNQQGDEPLNDYFKEIKKKGQSICRTSYITKNGIKMHIELSGKLIKHQNKNAILHLSRDITERQELEKQKLNIIIQTEENERKRFAKDIHDGLGATLSAAKMYMNIAKRAEPNSERAKDMFNQALWLIDNAGKTAKEISVNIRPHDLAHFGLSASLQSFCERLNLIGSFKVIFNAENFHAKLEEDIELNLFRTINELINNTLKYADAKIITINLLEKNKKVIIEYSDDGKGFDYHKVMNSNKPGTGLNNIINRAKLMGGNAKIESKKAKGMNAVITVGY